MFCIFFGHSNIISNCFGYVYCGRCGEQTRDTLSGYYRNPKAVVIGHNCDTCKANYKKLTWKDKFLTPNPFKKKKLHKGSKHSPTLYTG
jgi:hypothetical protein